MYFLIDKNNKILWGWSAKAACNHVKIMWNYFHNVNKLVPGLKTGASVHDGSYLSFPTNLTSTKKEFRHQWTVILFVRNPYSRLVSGYVEKYCWRIKSSGAGHHNYNVRFSMINSFRNFVDELERNGFKNINNHHFVPQLTEGWNDVCVPNKVYDIGNINYEHLENRFDKKLPKEILESGRTHSIKYTDRKEYVYDADFPNYVIGDFENQHLNNVPRYQYFYDDELKEKVTKIFKKDLDYFKQYGFDYESELKVGPTKSSNYPTFLSNGKQRIFKLKRLKVNG
ncbi:sulfotransferase family 2 domain-containing protein [Candidatus Woesearchaeota archaeon]|mgnify:CR=1 FL=1|nr:sulfotransferase family 2 domain-containing protein [Candidatus Woesearchaeota archaeon]